LWIIRNNKRKVYCHDTHTHTKNSMKTIVLFPYFSAEFQRQRVILIRFIALFFFCLSAFWHFRWQKMTSFNDSENNKNKWSGLIRVWPGGSGPRFSRANSRAGFCLNPDQSQARAGWVSGRPARPVRVLKLWYQYKKLFNYIKLIKKNIFSMLLKKYYLINK